MRLTSYFSKVKTRKYALVMDKPQILSQTENRLLSFLDGYFEGATTQNIQQKFGPEIMTVLQKLSQMGYVQRIGRDRWQNLGHVNN